MTRWKLTIEYDGSEYSGWQKQENAPSVQQALEEALQKFSSEEAELFCAGRTDAGVHARAQVAHVDLQKETNGDVVRDAVNFYLRPHKIAVLSAEVVDETFNARTSAIQRSYRYRILNRRAPPTFQSKYAWHIIHPLDINVMQRAADMLIGKHDFTTFRAANCQANSPLRTLDKLKVTREGEDVLSTPSRGRSFTIKCATWPERWLTSETATGRLRNLRTPSPLATEQRVAPRLPPRVYTSGT
jgi:tRNA pseudouridine38-40 synthase